MDDSREVSFKFIPSLFIARSNVFVLKKSYWCELCSLSEWIEALILCSCFWSSILLDIGCEESEKAAKFSIASLGLKYVHSLLFGASFHIIDCLLIWFVITHNVNLCSVMLFSAKDEDSKWYPVSILRLLSSVLPLKFFRGSQDQQAQARPQDNSSQSWYPPSAISSPTSSRPSTPGSSSSGSFSLSSHTTSHVSPSEASGIINQLKDKRLGSWFLLLELFCLNAVAECLTCPVNSLHVFVFRKFPLMKNLCQIVNIYIYCTTSYSCLCLVCWSCCNCWLSMCKQRAKL